MFRRCVGLLYRPIWYVRSYYLPIWYVRPYCMTIWHLRSIVGPFGMRGIWPFYMGDCSLNIYTPICYLVNIISNVSNLPSGIVIFHLVWNFWKIFPNGSFVNVSEFGKWSSGGDRCGWKLKNILSTAWEFTMVVVLFLVVFFYVFFHHEYSYYSYEGKFKCRVFTKPIYILFQYLLIHNTIHFYRKACIWVASFLVERISRNGTQRVRI